MCQCSNMELAFWGALGASVAYLMQPSPLAAAVGATAGILYRRQKNDGRDKHHEQRDRVSY